MDEGQLKKLLKAQLVNIARQRGIWVGSQNTKDAIIRKILGGGGGASVAPSNNFSRMLKPQLINIARQRGIWVTPKNTKNIILQKIRAGKNRPSAPKPTPAPAPAPKPTPAPAPAPKPTPAPVQKNANIKKRSPLLNAYEKYIRNAKTTSMKKTYLAAALSGRVVIKNSNNYKHLKSLIPPDKTINNLYKMSNNNLINEFRSQGFLVKNNLSRNSMIRSILANQGNSTGIMGGGNISNSLINAPSAKGVCRSGRLQITGTCWFQATMNPFLLSDIGRDILATKLAEFKKSNNMKKWTNINACPYKLSGAYFWSYVDYKLKENYTNLNEYKKVMKGELFTNERLIRNVKLKNNTNSINGGSLVQLVKFMDQVFNNDYGYHTSFETTDMYKFKNGRYNQREKLNNHPLVCLMLDQNIQRDFQPPEIIEKNNYKYKLFGAQINGYSKKVNNNGISGHSMTGYLCGDGKYMFYDSNSIRTTNLDWTTKSFWNEEFPKYMKRYYKDMYLMTGNFFYVRVGDEIHKKSIINIFAKPKKINNTKETNKKPKNNNKPKNNKKPLPWYKKLFRRP